MNDKYYYRYWFIGFIEIEDGFIEGLWKDGIIEDWELTEDGMIYEEDIEGIIELLEELISIWEGWFISLLLGEEEEEWLFRRYYTKRLLHNWYTLIERSSSMDDIRWWSYRNDWDI
jgi:hypothetical protein